jgi:predicted transcriptional regulator
MAITRNDNWSTSESKAAHVGVALSSEVRIRILKILIENPGLNASELSQKLKRHRTTIHKHLFFLKRANLVKEHYCIHQYQLFVNSKSENLLEYFI